MPAVCTPRKSTAGLAGATKEKRKQLIAAAAPKDVDDLKERIPPCRPCLNSALPGRDDGKCWEPVEQTGKSKRYGAVESVLLPARKFLVMLSRSSFFFLDYIQGVHDVEITDLDTEKHRKMVKCALDGIERGDFSELGDERMKIGNTV